MKKPLSPDAQIYQAGFALPTQNFRALKHESFVTEEIFVLFDFYF